MEKIITEITKFDHNRIKVILDYGEEAFVLYKNEFLRLGLNEGGIISDEMYKRLSEDILLPRAKKRVLYYMRTGDKTEAQIRRKLKDNYYPVDVIEETVRYMKKYGLIDDINFAGNFIEVKKKSTSKRQMEASLREKGVSTEDISRILGSITEDDEADACERAFRKKYPSGVSAEDRNKAYGFLARRGFSYEAIGRVMGAAFIDS